MEVVAVEVNDVVVVVVVVVVIAVVVVGDDDCDDHGHLLVPGWPEVEFVTPVTHGGSVKFLPAV